MNFVSDTQELQSSLHQEVLLHRITNRVRQSLELQEILAATVAEVRAFLCTDRVMMYRFHYDGSGEVIAESVNSDYLLPLLGLNFPADDIPVHAREMFLKARQRSIVDVASQQIGLSPLECPETGETLTTGEIHYRPASSCHLEYLKVMGVQFSLVVPLVCQSIRLQQTEPQLWGLLVAHHAKATSISDQELNIVQRVADQVSIAIAQSALYSQTQAKAQREAIINHVTALLHASPEIQLQAALEEVVNLLEGSGGRLYINAGVLHPTAELYTCGHQPSLLGETDLMIETHSRWQACLENSSESTCLTGSSCDYKVCAISDLYQPTLSSPLGPAFRNTPIRSILIVPLFYRQQHLGYLSIFRNAISTEIWWAGHFNSGQQQLQPRQSFQAWKELRHGQVHRWAEEEIELAQALGNHFPMAIQQHYLYAQVHQLNVNLERQVQERTAKLQRSLELDRAEKRITDQIRSTLDLKTILQTIVREVQALLNVDRALIYQFNQNWQGEVMVEAIKEGWNSVLGIKGPTAMECFPEEHAQLYLKGRIRAINDISQAKLAPCHRAFLQNLQVQANLIVPISIDSQLWGLLIVHECETPRSWQGLEKKLLQQLAAQAAIAIHQAELYEQSRAAANSAMISATAAMLQTQELEKALESLKHTQTQLIQTEKMSSLGQLVAGVAHEINNPVNFIFGNLSHTDEYTRNLLELVSLYQQHYPNPVKEIQLKSEEIDLEFLNEDLPKILTSMKVGADRIRQIVLSLRNFSRLDEALMKAVDIHEGIDSTLLILQNRLKAKPDYSGIQIIKKYGNLPSVECYVGQLNQVFMNIISNAIDAIEMGVKHSPAATLPEQVPEALPALTGGENPLAIPYSGRSFDESIGSLRAHNKGNPAAWIQIETALTSANTITIRISDNGPGMPENVRSRIFDPFFTTKPVGQGTGLGLSISYQIVVEKHGGCLKCASKPGEGTEFWIELPIRPLQ